MHIVFVFEDFCLGGVERVTEQLITGLLEGYNCRVSIICERKSGELTSRFDKLAPIYALRDKNALITFRRLADELNPDVILFTKGGLSKYGLFVPKKIKKIAVQHVPINLPQENYFKNLIRRLGATFLYSQLDKVVCVSKGILTNLITLNVVRKDQALCIYNPVLDKSIEKQAREKVDFDNYFVCVGRLHHQKGYDLLIETIYEAKKTINDIKVVIVGDGPEHDNLKEKIRSKKLSDNIILHGSQSNPYKYIANANAILLTSRWEGLPTVLVEAAFLKTPIIAFDCNYGPRELTNNGENGHLIDFMDIGNFANAILELNKQQKLPISPNVEPFLLSVATDSYYKLFKSLL